ncbi:TolB family protein [Sphingomonas sp.]|uniref:TolB family protein n=1 Tax=Sphingomonas sp. TaxID=28214 RepID=UPI003D6CDA95
MAVLTLFLLAAVAGSARHAPARPVPASQVPAPQTPAPQTPAPQTPTPQTPTPRARVERLPFSTAVSDVRLAISPDERHILWGMVNRTPGSGLEIVESWLADGVWSAPVAVSFNGPANDFDPSFSPDGRQVYFFSNRPGGAGGDDLYVVAFDPVTRRYGVPRNLGARVNTPGDEWAPSLSPDGTALLFSSNRHGVPGGQNLFIAPLRGQVIGTPVALGPAVNGAEDDFDATFLGSAHRIVFARGDAVGDKGTRLYAAHKGEKGWQVDGVLPPEINCSAGLNIGPSTSSSGQFYWSAACGPGDTRLDLWRSDFPAPAGPP